MLNRVYSVSSKKMTQDWLIEADELQGGKLVWHLRDLFMHS
jgi:hypothetical protein